MVNNKDYLGMFLISGVIGIGCKMVLSVNAGDCESERRMLHNIPIASVISGLLFLSAVDILPGTLGDEASQN